MYEEEQANPELEEEMETPTATPTEEETDADDSNSDENDGAYKPKEPWHTDKRWIEMYDKAKRVDELESQLEETRSMVEEIKSSRKEEEPTVMPKWFFGDEEAWQDYQTSDKASKEAFKQEVIESLRQEQQQSITAEEEEVSDYKEYFDSEIESLKEDFSFDEEALKDYVIDNEIVDSRGIYDLKRGLMKMMSGKLTTANPARKTVAGMTSSKSSVEPEKKEYATPDDFVGGNRPW